MANFRKPKIYSIPLAYTGSRETFVVVIDGTPQSIDTWNFTEDEKGNRTFYIDGTTVLQLYFQAGTTVQVIR